MMWCLMVENGQIGNGNVPYSTSIEVLTVFFLDMRIETGALVNSIFL